MSEILSRRVFLKRVGLLPCAGLATAAAFGGKDALGQAAPADAGSATSNPTGESPIIDAHVHVWTHDPQFPFAPETKNPPARDATAEQLIALMKASGVYRTVIIQVIHYRWDNRYAASVLKRYPQYFRGVARVNPQDPAAPDHLSRLVEEDGFHGVRISPSGEASGDWINGPLMPPLWARCRDLKVPMTVLAPVTRMPDVMRLADQFPDLTIVIDHMADCPLNKPDELEKLLALQRFPNLFVKISHTWSLSAQAYPYLDSQRQVRRLYDAYGPKRLIAGTDWPLVEPYCTYTQAIDIARFRIDFLSTEDKRWICGLTAARVWPLLDGAS
jgi:predicted TIM-barrel fold metal-dependent hydrolase